MRTCIGCRAVTTPAEMVRIARDGPTLGLGPHLPGRGAWLCAGKTPGVPSEDCLELAVRRQAFGRAFRVAVAAEAVAALRVTVQERARIESGAAVGGARRRD
jgi:hypothetical protein